MDIYRLIESKYVRNYERKYCALTPYEMVELILATTILSLEEKKIQIVELRELLNQETWKEEYKKCDFLDPCMETDKKQTIANFSYEDWIENADDD